MSQVRTLLLVRHGLPDYRLRKADDESPGPPLSDLGRMQAQQAAAVLMGFDPIAIHCSPLARARQTAECFRRALAIPVTEHSDLKEWHRTESLYQVSVRSARWLAHWQAGDEPCAAVVGHASPLLAIIRSALYLPHVGWYRSGHPDQLRLDTCDRFEMSMASVFALTVEPRQVTAELVFHPEPRIAAVLRGRHLRTFPRPIIGDGENDLIRRPNFTSLIGCARQQ